MRSLLKKPLPIQTAQPILESELMNLQTQELYAAKVYESMVVIGDQYLEYEFDIRFSVREK